MTDKQLYKKTFDTVISSGMKSVEVDEMIKMNRKTRGFKRKIAVAAIAICILFCGGGVVYAYTNGIFDNLLQDYTVSFNEQEKEMAEDVKGVETEPGDLADEALSGEEIFENALSQGYVEQVEMYLNEYGVHDYRRVRKIAKEELEGAYYNDDYTELTIQGVVYHAVLQYKDFDEEDPEKGTTNVWVFDEENWSNRSSIMAEEIQGCVKESVAKPIINGHAAIYNNEDAKGVFERELTKEECDNAQISLYGLYVKLGEEVYVVNDGLDGWEICLRPAQGYLGDAPVDEETLNAETFFTVDEWMAK